MKPITRSYFLIVLMAVVFSACYRPEAKETAWVRPVSMNDSCVKPVAAKHVTRAPANLVLQSHDGGLTWRDISTSLPELEHPESFFAGESDLYLRVNDVTYRSKSNLKTPVWEKDDLPEMNYPLLTFNRSGVVAFDHDGRVYERTSASSVWLPAYLNLKMNKLLMISETSDGTLFFGRDHGLFRSTDGGEQWKQVNEGWGSEIVESAGVLVGTGRKGIMRSTDNGETWEWVINEGGVGIDIEKIKGGFAAIVYNARTQSRSVLISEDGGKTWEARNDGLPPSKTISSIKQMGNFLICGHSEGIFRSSDKGRTWMRVYPGVEEFKYVTTSMLETTDRNEPDRVFSIHVSGNTLYAVLGNAGC